MTHLKLTVEVLYEANPVHYSSSDPAEMAELDQTVLERDFESIIAIIEGCDDDKFKFKVEPTEQTTFVNSDS